MSTVEEGPTIIGQFKANVSMRSLYSIHLLSAHLFSLFLSVLIVIRVFLIFIVTIGFYCQFRWNFHSFTIHSLCFHSCHIHSRGHCTYHLSRMYFGCVVHADEFLLLVHQFVHVIGARHATLHIHFASYRSQLLGVIIRGR